MQEPKCCEIGWTQVPKKSVPNFVSDLLKIQLVEWNR